MSLYRKLRSRAYENALKKYSNSRGDVTAIDDNTARSIDRGCKRFAEWAATYDGCTRKELLTDHDKACEAIQEYQRYLSTEYRQKSGKTLSPDTVHTYLAYPCSALGVHMQEIQKDRRTHMIRSTGDHGNRTQNRQGDREETEERFARVVEFQRRVGVRRSELAKLTIDNIKCDQQGYMCIEVERGKGGKYQLQRVLPADRDTVQRIIDSHPAGSDRLFSPEEMRNKIDLHALRAGQGWKAYSYYADRLASDPGYREQLRKELVVRYQEFNPGYNTDAGRSRWQRFRAEVYNDKAYYLRKGSVATAEELGRPLAYDRTALMAASVYHLSHWRLDVTVINYVLK